MQTLRERRAYGLRLPKSTHPELRQLRSRHAPSTADAPRLLLADPGRPSCKIPTTLTHSGPIEEALIDWPGKRPIITGQLLTIGDFTPPSSYRSS